MKRKESALKQKIFLTLTFASIFCLFIVPLLIPNGALPLPKFYCEAAALLFAMLVVLFSVFATTRIQISNIAIAMLLFAIVLLSQIFLLHINFPGVNIVIALEAVIGALLSIAITSLMDNSAIKQKQLATIVAWSVVISTLIQAIYGLLQVTGAAANYPHFILFIGSNSENIFGNLAQKNDYADFLSIGVFAASYLYITRRVNLFAYSIYALFLISIITISSSRTTFLYFIVAIFISLVFVWMNKNNDEQKCENRKIIKLLVGLFITLVLMELFLPKILMLISSQFHILSGFDRFEISNINQGTYRRFYEWYKDIIIFLQHPLLGVGWFQYPKQEIDLMLTQRFMYIPANTDLFTHSHNTPLNILAETGIIGFTITVVYGFGYSMFRMFKNFNNHTTLFLSFMYLTIFVQGLFQYPLWYTYFLMYFIVFLSMDKAVLSFNNTELVKGCCLTISCGFFYFIFINSIMYNKLATFAQIPDNNDDFKANVVYLEQVIDHNLLWSLPVLQMLDGYNLPGNYITNYAFSHQDQIKYADMLGNELPFPGVIFKQMVVHRFNGDIEESIYYADLFAHAYPFYKDKFANTIASQPLFADEVSEIRGFKYQDKSIFAKIFPKNSKDRELGK